MNTFSRVAIALVGMTGLVAAQPKTDPKAGGDMKAADAKAGAMPEMKPPAELATMAKMAAGTWTCKGQGMDRTMKMTDMTGSMKMKLDVSGWWMHASFESKMGKEPFQFESFTTFDPASKRWKRVMVESGSGWSSGESAGLQNNKVDWELTSHSPMGEFMFRDHEDLSDPKAGAKMWGEFSPDKGKTWTKVYEMTCKK
ncbi:MAG TPA: hypothetical protein VF469_16540 [Kofleriaceae bacterium]